jgi:hypothetical protein
VIFVQTRGDKIMRKALAIVLSSEQRVALERPARARSEPARVVEQASIILLAAAGLENKQIAQLMGIMLGNGISVAGAVFSRAALRLCRRTRRVRASRATSPPGG